MKAGTRDTCRNCGRLIEWAEAPYQEDENGRDLRPYWQRYPQWVDVEPPGEAVWNTYCDLDELLKRGRGMHEPTRYCNGKRGDGQPCNVRVTDDTEGLGSCKRHLKSARREANHKKFIVEKDLFSKWEEESIEARIKYLRNHRIDVYLNNNGWVPSRLREGGAVVDLVELASALEKLEMLNEQLKREIDGDEGKSRTGE